MLAGSESFNRRELCAAPTLDETEPTLACLALL